jgi:hypothetical protein
VVVLEARQVKTTLSSLRNKTDRNDARGIAQILRTGWYREVHVKSLESQRLKTLLTARKALLRRRIDLENEIRGPLKVYGVKILAFPAPLSGAFAIDSVKSIIRDAYGAGSHRTNGFWSYEISELRFSP